MEKCTNLEKIKELGEKLAELERFNSLIVEAINSSHEGIAILDKNGNYIYINKAHEVMFGYERGELIGKSWETLYTQTTRDWFLENVTPVLRKTGYWSGETIGICKNKKTIVEQIVYLTLLPNGRLICTCRDKIFNKRKWH